MFAGLAVFLAATVLAAPCQAQAAQAATPPPELRLTWEAPDECPPAAEVEAQFDRLLGGPGRVPSAKRVEATATVRRAAGGAWSLRLDTTVDDAVGHRDLEGDSCWAVANATALVLALTIDPNAAARALPTPPPEPSPPPSAPASEASVAVAARPAEEAPLQPFLRVFGGAVVALLPAPTPLAGLAAGIRRTWFDVELSTLASLESRAQAPERPGAGGYFRVLAFGVRGCARATTVDSPIALRLCAGGEVERIDARGYGVELPGTGGATLVAALGAAVASLRLASRVDIAFELIGTARPYHPEFVLTRVGNVFAVPTASAVGAIGLRFSL